MSEGMRSGLDLRHLEAVPVGALSSNGHFSVEPSFPTAFPYQYLPFCSYSSYPSGCCGVDHSI